MFSVQLSGLTLQCLCTVTVLCKHCENCVSWEHFPAALLSLDGWVPGSWGLWSSAVCQSLKENNVPSWAEFWMLCIQRHQSLETGWWEPVEGTTPYPRKAIAITTPPLAWGSIGLGFRGMTTRTLTCQTAVQVLSTRGHWWKFRTSWPFQGHVLTACASLEPWLPHRALERGTAPYSSCLAI